MAKVFVKPRGGAAAVELPVYEGQPLMEALRDANLGVAGTCGGACACGTCHVYVSGAAAAKLAPRSDDEQMMLEAIGELVEVRPNSRLSCQIADNLDGLEVEIGPVA